MILEVACFSYEDAMIAIEGGADRIELCKNQSVGGHSPSTQAARELCKTSRIPVYIMIRVSGRNFMYNEQAFAKMKKQLKWYKSFGCDGFVFGTLDEEGRVNKKQCKELVKLAKPLPCTFHRAFDLTPDKEKALEDVIECGFTRILTSGGPGNAIDNLEILKQLFKKAGKRIKIIPGGGVRASNVQQITRTTRCKEIHSAATDPTRRRISIKEIKAMKALLR